jgi:hypothetical protein
MVCEHDEDEHVKEVYARFESAVYYAQVLEHGLVNALVILDLIPNRRHLVRSRDEWQAPPYGWLPDTKDVVIECGKIVGLRTQEEQVGHTCLGRDCITVVSCQ